MDIRDAIKNRRSIRAYTEKEVSVDDMKKILELTRFSPTASNSQAWKFEIVLNAKLIEDIVTFSPGIWERPPALLVIAMDRDIALAKSGRQSLKETMFYDAGIAAYVSTLVAMSMGISSCIVASFNKNAVAELLKMKEPIEPMLLLTMGYARNPAVTPRKRRLTEVLTGIHI